LESRQEVSASVKTEEVNVDAIVDFAEKAFKEEQESLQEVVAEKVRSWVDEALPVEKPKGVDRPAKARYNTPILGPVSTEDREAALPVLPENWPELLSEYLRFEMMGKIRGPTTSAILAGKARGWLAKFDVHSAGLTDSTLIVEVVGRAIARAQVSIAADGEILKAMDRELDHVHRVNAFYGQGVLGFHNRWRWVIGVGFVCGSVVWAMCFTQHREGVARILNAPFESSWHKYDWLYLESPKWFSRRVGIPLVRKVFGKNLGYWLARTVSPRMVNPYLGVQGAVTWLAGFGVGAGVTRRFLPCERRQLSITPN